MATINDFRAWYERDLSRFASWDKSVEVVSDNIAATPNTVSPPGAAPYAARQITIRIFTDNNRYSIRVEEPRLDWQPLNPDVLSAQWREGDQGVMRQNNGYLGCTATSRKPRAGEDWQRGNDLRDGPFTEATWHAILGDILSYELVVVHLSHKEAMPTIVAPPVGAPPPYVDRNGAATPSDEFLKDVPYETVAAIRRLASSVQGGRAWADAQLVVGKLDALGVAVDA